MTSDNFKRLLFKGNICLSIRISWEFILCVRLIMSIVFVIPWCRAHGVPLFNLLVRGDAVWRHRTWSTLVLTVACHLSPYVQALIYSITVHEYSGTRTSWCTYAYCKSIVLWSAASRHGSEFSFVTFGLRHRVISRGLPKMGAVLTHWGQDKMDAISQTPFSSAFSWTKMFEFRLKFHWSLFLRVQLTILQHWFR